jgi:hypothetical protein
LALIESELALEMLRWSLIISKRRGVDAPIE